MTPREKLGDPPSEQDAIVAELRRLAPSIKESSERAWTREPAVRVIDCVLSLNRNYDRFVVPRLDRFEKAYPEIRSISDLACSMKEYSSAHSFVRNTLKYNHEARAIILDRLVEYLVEVGGGSDERLNRWAAEAKPANYTQLGMPGFGLAGFQYRSLAYQPAIHQAPPWPAHP